MRSTRIGFLSFVLLAALAGCGNGTSKGDMAATPDLTATAVGDMAGQSDAAPPDMAMQTLADMAMTPGDGPDMAIQFNADLAGGLACSELAGCYGTKCGGMPCQLCDAMAKKPQYATDARAAYACYNMAAAGPCAQACAMGSTQCNTCVAGTCNAGVCMGGQCSMQITTCNMDK